MFSFRPFNEKLQSLRSTGALDFFTPKPKKEIFKQSLIYSGPVIWNNLPDCLKGTYQGFSFFIANSFYMSDFMYLLRTQIIFYNVQ